VFDLLARPTTALCPPGNVLLVTGEPPPVQRYHPRYLGQFATVVTSIPDLDHPRLVIGQTGLPWHLGRRQRRHVNLGFHLGYDELKAMDVPAKDKDLSLICSTAAGTAGHRRRNRFVEALQDRLGDRIDVFGRGRREVEDKWDALARYRYTVALENCACRHYWTEKLADPFLAWCFPFYFGCPNLDEYFPPESFCPIDLEAPERSAALIEARIAAGTWERVRPQLGRARELVLDRYNLFALLAEHCGAPAAEGKVPVALLPLARRLPLRIRAARALGARLRRLRRS
jgi:hypothetical protein